jgi:hypothetical protein
MEPTRTQAEILRILRAGGNLQRGSVIRFNYQLYGPDRRIVREVREGTVKAMRAAGLLDNQLQPVEKKP